MKKADVIDVIHKVHAHLPLDIFGKIRDGQIQRIAQLLKADLLAVIAVDIIDDLLHALLVLRVFLLEPPVVAADHEAADQHLQKFVVHPLERHFSVTAPVKILAEDLFERASQIIISGCFIQDRIAPEEQMVRSQEVPEHAEIDLHISDQNFIG